MRRLRGLFGMRSALSGESAAFFGVESRVDRVLANVVGHSSTNCVALVGPARSGRSTLLRRIAHAPDLTRNGAPGALTVEVEMRDSRSRPEDALAELVRRLAQAMVEAGLPASAVAGTTSLRSAVAAALGSFDGRLLFVLDDFEYVASELRKADQIEMRQAVYKQDRVAYVVGSRIPLSHCTEEFGDALSEIAPLFTTLFIEPLTVREVERAVRNACPWMSPEDVGAISQFAYSLVGGFPEWVQRALAVTAEMFEAEPGATAAVVGLHDDAIESVLVDLSDDLRRSFSRLPSSARRLLLTLPATPPVAFTPSAPGHNELFASGWIAKVKNGEPVRLSGAVIEAWLSRRGGDVLYERPPEPLGRYERLVSAVDVLNDRYRHATGKGGPKLMRPDVFTIPRHMPHLLRNVRNRGELDSFAHALALLLYDGTGGGTAGKQATTLPQWCYDDPRSVVRHVTDLRHATAHLPHVDEDEESKRQEALARVYARYLDVRSPAVERDFRLLADNIFDAAITFIEKITTYVPFAANLSPDAVFGARGQ